MAHPADEPVDERGGLQSLGGFEPISPFLRGEKAVESFTRRTITMSQLKIDPKTAALLVMDFQTDIVAMVGADQEALLSRTAKLIAGARQAGARVMYVVVGFRAGYPEVSPRNASFGAIRETGRFADGAPGSEIHVAVAPKPGDVVVTKHRVSAFAGTDLEMVLRANGIEALVLAGLATSGVVLSTLRHAADADYRILVVEDCCADRDPEVHRVLMEKVFIRQATVVRAEAVQAGLSS
jgi:nicotinamidase-related amidase